ncbi:MAG: helicase-related protein [Candidatus Methylopumilus sp.]
MHKKLSSTLALDEFHNHYPVARGLNRQIYFHLGPTNSGKTYQALIKLQTAASGVYLAPLRLLAMEIRDRLMEAGVPCNLITGEERQFVAGAKHTACTVEMMNPNQAVDVAIIDEIQMLQDESRGYAWTAALIGAPAKQVFVCGANSVTTPCIKAIEALGESYEITYLERKTPLLLEGEGLSGQKYNRFKLKGKLQKGDAVIAFSRKDVLTLSARFRQWGHGVASIYGALSPEVRRTESRRFCEGDADILVATDAIGMGLNLPIRRVIFSSIDKFDGLASRQLNATEVRQIAGRAGRFGIYDTGYVSAFENDELIHLEHMLSTSDVADLDKLPVSPSFAHLSEIADTLHTNQLSVALNYFAERISINSTLFAIAPLQTQIQLALLVDEYAPKLHLKDKFIFSCAPIGWDKARERDYFLSCLACVAQQQKKALPSDLTWLNSSSPKHLEAAEDLSKDISLYAWLAHKFPKHFYQLDELPALRNKVSRYIEAALLVQAGYQDTSKELMYQSGLS